MRPTLRLPAQPPSYWAMVGGWLGLSEMQAAHLWRTVSASTHPAVRSWRLALTYFHAPNRERCRDFLRGPMAPQRVVAVLEVLVEEGKLSRRQANQIEETVLSQTTAEGYWT